MVATGAHGAVITEIVDEARTRGIQVQSTDRRRMDEIAFNHQGVIAEADPFSYASLEDLLEATNRVETPLVLVLDTVQDPQNFGSLLRTAAAVGAQGAIIPEHRAVGVTPAVVKASAGAIEWLTIVQVGNLVRAIEALKASGMWIVGLDARGDAAPGSIDLSGPLAIVVGGEEKGLRPLVRSACDFIVSLPMPGPVESLNAGVAGSVVLYEALRQRTRAGVSVGTVDDAAESDASDSSEVAIAAASLAEGDMADEMFDRHDAERAIDAELAIAELAIAEVADADDGSGATTSISDAAMVGGDMAAGDMAAGDAAPEVEALVTDEAPLVDESGASTGASVEAGSEVTMDAVADSAEGFEPTTTESTGGEAADAAKVSERAESDTAAR